MLRVGDVLFGYCGGNFGRDSHADKRVESIGADWVIAREEDGKVVFAQTVPENLERYKEEE